MILQVATEAAKGSSRFVLDAPMIGLIVTNGVLIWRDYIRTKRAKKNGNGVQPGKGDVCEQHGTELTTLKTKQEGTDKAIDEMKGHINTIEGDVKTLLQRIPPKE